MEEDEEGQGAGDWRSGLKQRVEGGGLVVVEGVVLVEVGALVVVFGAREVLVEVEVEILVFCTDAVAINSVAETELVGTWMTEVEFCSISSNVIVSVMVTIGPRAD